MRSARVGSDCALTLGVRIAEASSKQIRGRIRAVVVSALAALRFMTRENCPIPAACQPCSGAAKIRRATSHLFFCRGSFVFEAGRDHWLKKWHHGAKFGAELLDGVLLLALARGQEVRTALFIFCDPGFCETAVSNLREDFAHLVARLLGDDARPGGIIALLGSIADGVTHVAEAAAVNQVNDKLEFVETFEVSNLRLVTGFRQCFKPRLDQFTHTAAENRLLAKEISF